MRSAMAIAFGDGRQRPSSRSPNAHGVPRAEEEHAHRLALVEDRQDRERREGVLRLRVVTHDLEQRVRRRVLDDERLAAREHLLDLGVLREIDGQIAELLVVADAATT